MLSVWGPSLSHDLPSRLEKMLNRAVSMVYGLRKFDLVEKARLAPMPVINSISLFVSVVSLLP